MASQEFISLAEFIPKLSNINHEIGVRTLVLDSSTKRTAKYFLIEYLKETNTIKDYSLETIKNFMCSEEGFDFPKPKLLLSIHGSAKHFAERKINEQFKQSFKKALIRIASNTDAWIISSGTDSGVYQLVGDAVKEDPDGMNITLLGITPYLTNRINIIDFDYPTVPSTEKINLNPNHNAFIFVKNQNKASERDDNFGREREFRRQLEEYISENEDIPSILIILQGGLSSLEPIVGALEKNTPIIMFEGPQQSVSGIIKELIEVQENKQDVEKEEWKKEIKKILHKYKFEMFGPVVEEKKYLTARTYLNRMWKYKEKLRECIDIIDLTDSSEDIEEQILETLRKKPEIHPHDKIQLPIKWNRIDLFEKFMKESKNMENETDEDKENVFKLALLLDGAKFVQYLIQSGVDMKNKINMKSLFNEKSYANRSWKNPMLFYLKHSIKLKSPISNQVYSSSSKDNKTEQITLDVVKDFLKHVFSKLKDNFFNTDSKPNGPNGPNRSIFLVTDKNLTEDPTLDLFLWCILSNRIECAKLFWMHGKHQICWAIIASEILWFFSKELPDDKHVYLSFSQEFKNLALGVLDVFEEYSRDAINDVLVIQYLYFIQMDVLQLARLTHFRKFLSHKVVTRSLDKIWYASYKKYDLTPYEVNLRKCQQSYNEDENYLFYHNSICSLDTICGEKKTDKKMSIQLRWKNLLLKNIAPKSKYILFTVFYFIFCIFFSYIMLMQVESVDFVDNECRGNSSSVAYKKPISTTPLILLSISCYWVIAYVFGEIIEISSLKHGYWFVYRNILTLAGYILFFIGYLLYILYYSLFDCKNKEQTKEFLSASRLILSIDLLIFYIKSLKAFTRSEILGPRLHMIFNMFKDFISFLVILGTFFLAFGVALKSIISPQREFNVEFIYDILSKTYWPIHGQISILPYLTGQCGNKDQPKCLDEYSRAVSTFLLIIYLIITTILLLNLIIAIFSLTISKVQEKSDEIRRVERYRLISEFTNSPYLPPPFIFGILSSFQKMLGSFLLRLIDLKRKRSDPGDERTLHQKSILVELERSCARKVLERQETNCKKEVYFNVMCKGAKDASVQLKKMINTEDRTEYFKTDGITKVDEEVLHRVLLNVPESFDAWIFSIKPNSSKIRLNGKDNRMNYRLSLDLIAMKRPSFQRDENSGLLNANRLNDERVFKIKSYMVDRENFLTKLIGLDNALNKLQQIKKTIESSTPILLAGSNEDIEKLITEFKKAENKNTIAKQLKDSIKKILEKNLYLILASKSNQTKPSE